MKKNLLIFAVATLLGIASVFGQSGTDGHISWNISDNTLTISGSAGPVIDYFYYTGTGSTAPWCKYNFTTAVIEGITSIGNNFFRGCKNLTTVTIGSSVMTIRADAFRDCSSLTTINFNATSCTSVSSNCWLNCTSIKTLNIGDNVQVIPGNAFRNCSGITSVTIPNLVKTIGSEAFYGWNDVTSVTIGSGLTSISNLPLSGNKLTQIIVSEQNQNFSSIDGVLFNKDKTAILRFPEGKSGTTYNIPNAVTTIGSSTFANCRNLTSITIPNLVTTIKDGAFSCSGITSIIIPNLVTTIGYEAFGKCINLESITIPNSVITIENDAFLICESLTSVIIPNSVKTIGKGAFQSCFGLTSVIIGNSVTAIGMMAFRDCSRLTSIKSYAVTPPTTDNSQTYANTFYNVSKSISVSVFCESEDDYKRAAGWEDFTNYCNCLSATGFNKVTEANINIYPNPASNKLYIEGEGYEQVNIYDMLGKEVLSAGKEKEIDISRLVNGVYNISLISKGKTVVTKKLIKE